MFSFKAWLLEMWRRNQSTNINPNSTYLPPTMTPQNDFNLAGIMPNGSMEQYQGCQLLPTPSFPYQPPQEFAAYMYGGLISRT